MSDRAGAAAATAAAVLAAALAGTPPSQAADAPPGALSCSGCHPAHAVTGAPAPLAGQAAGAIVAAMRAFRDGRRSATVMDRIARGFPDAEVEAMATWFETRR